MMTDIERDLDARNRRLEDISCRQQNEIERLRAALREIVGMAAAARGPTLARDLADIAVAALDAAHRD